MKRKKISRFRNNSKNSLRIAETGKIGNDNKLIHHPISWLGKNTNAKKWCGSTSFMNTNPHPC